MEEHDADEKKPGVVDISALDIHAILSFVIGILSTKAWQYIGLQVDPTTQEIAQDFDKAKLAIDCVSFLIEKLAPALGADERDRLKAFLVDLQLNYVKQREKIQQ